MALANFFDKAALAATQILGGFDHMTFAATLEEHVVGLAFDDEAVRSSEGRVTLSLTVDLLARLYPRVAFIERGAAATRFAAELAEQAHAINPTIEIVTTERDVAACLAVGATSVELDVPVVYVGSSGWVVSFSPTTPVGSGTSANPFGASAAACFGAANLFRMLFGVQLPNGNVDPAWTMSLWDYVPNSTHLADPELVTIDFGETHLVGLGAIGHGAIWALSRVPNIHGVLHLIDDQMVELTNLQRYAGTHQDDVGSVKVELAAAALQASGINVQPHALRWGDYLRERGNWHLDRVAVAVDSAEDRQAIQASLPRWLVNAWTQPGDLGVSRHRFVDDQACLMCLYFPEGERPSLDSMIADAIGLPEEVVDVRERLATEKPTEEAYLERVAAALGIPAEPLFRFAGQPLGRFYTEAICGGVVLALGGTPDRSVQAQVPMAFQSALAGVMLAAELVAHAIGRTPQPPTVTRLDLLRPLGTQLCFPITKHPSGRCICTDKDFRDQYQAKYLYPDINGDLKRLGVEGSISQEEGFESSSSEGGDSTQAETVS